MQSMFPPIPDRQLTVCKVKRRVKVRRAYEVMKHCCIIKRKITCSWYTNHFQLVELFYSIPDVIDSIRVNTRQYTKYGYVQNGYYPLMKYSIRILREMQGWPLSSQKAVWLLTIHYYRWLSLDFHLDWGWRLEYRIYWSAHWSVTSLSRRYIFATW